MKDIRPYIRRRKALKDRAYDVIKGMICAGKLSTQRLYNEGRLAEELGMSRTPVREALLELSCDGLISFIPGRGIQIIDLTEIDIHDIFEIRKLIEGYIIRRVSTQLSASELAALAKQHVLMTGKQGYAFIECDRKIHRILSAKLGNSSMDALLCNLWSKIQRIALCAIEDGGDNDRIIEEHEAILVALCRSDEGLAHESLLDHLCNSEKRLIAYTVSQIDDEDVPSRW